MIDLDSTEREQQKLCIWDFLNLTICIFGVGGIWFWFVFTCYNKTVIIPEFCESEPWGEVVGTPGFIVRWSDFLKNTTLLNWHLAFFMLLYFFLCQLHVQVLYCSLVPQGFIPLPSWLKTFSHLEINWLLTYILFLLLCLTFDGAHNTLPQSTAPWHTEYFKLKEFEKEEVQDRFFYLLLKQVIKSSCKRCLPYTQSKGKKHPYLQR